MRAYQESASEVVRGYEGHIAQYLVDGLVVYFGYPQAHEYAAARAARAGLDMLSAVQELNRKLELEHGTRLASRIGIHTGPVVIGKMGTGENSEPLALGSVPHVAARVQAVAEPGRVFVTGATQRLVSEMFIMEDGGAPVFEGMREPFPVYRLIGPSGATGRLSPAAGHVTPFVGRDGELDTLVEHWDAARRGGGRSVLVSGEAGIGKSRLIYELHQRLESEAHTWLECGASPYTVATSFHPVIALVAQGLGFAAEDTTAAKQTKVERGLGGLATAENVALIAELLSLPTATQLRFSPELRRRKTIELLADWTLTISADQPAVVVVEDLHWCDPSSLELMGHLVERCSAARLLVLVTARPDFTPQWQAGDHTATVELERLAERQAMEMVTSLASEAVPESTLDALATRSDGVPLYVEELAKSMLESDAAVGAEAIPTTLADSLMGRLDRLGQAKEVAQRAAVLGREFDYSLLAAVSDIEDATLRRELQRLLEAGIVFAHGEPPHATFVFKHALIQETAYQSLLKRTRQQTHARIGQVLEEGYRDYSSSRPELIARHYDRAAVVAKAIPYYQLAGERAADRSANEESIVHLQRALALVETLPESRERQQRELALLMAIAAPLSAARGWSNPEYEGVFVRARALATEIGASPELPRVIEGMATAVLMKGDVAPSIEIAREVLATAETTGDTFDLLIGHVCLGVPLLFQGNFASALEHLTQAMALYDPTDEPALGYMVGFDRGIAAHAYAGLCLVYLGRPDRALALSQQAVALARRLDHPLTLVNTLMQVVFVLYERRELDVMQEPVGELIGIADELGFPVWSKGGSLFRGAARVENGEADEGLAEMQQALAGLAEVGNGLGAPAAMVVLAESLLKAERYDEAMGVVDLGVGQAELFGQHFTDAEFDRLRAEVLLASGAAAADEAETLLGRAVETAQKQGAKMFALRAAVRLGRLWQGQQKRGAARDLVAPIYAELTEGADTLDAIGAAALLTELGS